MADRHNYTCDVFSHRPFKDLKVKLRKKGTRIDYTSETKKEEIPLSDEEIFLRAMNKVREIREFREIEVRPKSSTPPTKRPLRKNNEVDILEEIVRGKRPIYLPHTQEYVEWMDKDCNPEIVKQLHEGAFSVQDSLDLHGLNIDDAEKEVETFIRGAYRKGFRYLKIVHGRGLRSRNGPVLKKLTVQLLSTKYRKKLLAFVTARQCDGGLGALYILLRS